VDLKDLTCEEGLLQDQWSTKELSFGAANQLVVIGYNGAKYNNKFYILICHQCSKDPELFGEGYFKSTKSNLIKGAVPCGCGKNPRWSKQQYSVLCSRKATELGYLFMGFAGGWKGRDTKIKMLCEKHGEWVTGSIHNLINSEQGCPSCGAEITAKSSTKPDDVMIKSFHDSASFHPETEFWRSGRLNSYGYPTYWHVFCPICSQQAESLQGNLQAGYRPCGCSKQQQKEAYINLICDDADLLVAVKFGVARNSIQRTARQSSKSVYKVSNHSVYIFPTVQFCKKAERECKQELECGVVLKRDMPDGYTETTWVYNLDKIVEIYERNGGLKK
jgi:hypothetical protein